MTRHAFITACLLHAVLIGAGYMSLPPMALRIAAEGWPLVSVERAWALLPLFSIPSAFLTARLLGHFDARRLIAAVAMLGACSLALRAFAPGFAAYAVLLAFYGMMTGILLTLLTLEVGSAPTEQQGRRQAIFFGSYALGAAASLTAAEYLARSLGGWRPVQGFWGVLSLIIALSACAKFADSTGGLSPIFSTGSYSRSRAIRYAATYAAYVGAYLGLSNILPTRLRLMGWEPGLADLASAGSTIGFLAGSIVLGWLSDRFSQRDRMFRAGMAAMALFVVTGWVLAVHAQVAASLALFSLSGACAGAMSLFFAQMMTDAAFSGWGRARLVSGATASSYAGGFLVPFGLAALGDAMSLASPVIIASLLLLAGFLLPRPLDR